MNELCFMSNFTSAELAAWVQAVGSVLAIIAAIFIARHQHQTTLARERQVAKQRVANAQRLCAAFSENLIVSLQQIISAYESNEESIFERQEQRLKELVLLARSIEMAVLPIGAVYTIVNLRNIAADAIGDMTVLKEGGYFVGMANVPVERFQALLRGADEENEQLRSSFAEEVYIEKATS